ncbi:MAG TPA: TonB-dependent receptor [Rhizomicrobium sp.]|nr:TonB-dependent receptor [Rhizomicrobium sp.]
MRNRIAYGLLTGAAVAALAAPAAHSQEMAANDVETVVVFGTGEARQTQTVSQSEITAAAPGTSPLLVVSKLPGVNFTSADAFGAYEWSTRISIRGFNQNQLGFTLDDVPLGDMSYGNYNGLHISRAISSENIGSTELAQGAGALGTASTSNLGGTLAFHSSAPHDAFGVYASASYGSFDTTHAFVRLDTGELPTGTSAYISYGFQESDKWKGVGLQKQQQVNGKIEQKIGDTATLTGWLNYSARRENDYQDMSLEMLNRLGYKWDNISGDWPLAVQLAEIYQNQQAPAGGPLPYPAAGTAFPAPFKTVDDAYFNAAGLRNDAIGGVTGDWAVTENLQVRITGYGHNNSGQGLWWTPYVPTSALIPGAAPISIRTTEYAINRYGVVSSVVLTLQDHRIEGGVWYENNNFRQARRYYGLDADGLNRTSLQFQEDPLATQWAYAFNTTTLVFHLQDDWQITDALKLSFGFKTQTVNNSGHLLAGQVTVPFLPVSATTFTGGKIKTDQGFLPQVGAVYNFGEAGEVFADYAKNQRAFVSAATNGPFSTTQPGFDAIKGNLKPETSQTYEGGYRFHFDGLTGDIAGYYVEFNNRQLAQTVGAGIVGNPSVLSNVGSVTSKGIEAAATWRFWDNMWAFASYSYDDSTYDDDVLDATGAVTMHTKGRTTVDTPKNILNAQIGYDDETFFGQVGVAYMGRRFVTYENDISVPSHTLVSANAGYRIHSDNFADGLEIQVNADNLFNERYISTIGSNGFVAHGDSQTLLPGAPQSFYVTLRKQF